MPRRSTVLSSSRARMASPSVSSGAIGSRCGPPRVPPRRLTTRVPLLCPTGSSSSLYMPCRTSSSLYMPCHTAQSRASRRPTSRASSDCHPPYVSVRQHTSAYVTYVSICQHTSEYVSIRQHTSAYVSIASRRQHTSAYVSIRHRARRRPTCRASSDCTAYCRQRQYTITYVAGYTSTYLA